MKSDLVSILEGESQRLIRTLDEYAPAQRLYQGTIGAAEYAWFLEQSYHYVRWTRPLLAQAGLRLAQLGKSPALAEVFRRKADEETGHELWALSDLRALGHPEQAIKRRTPALSTQAYIAWNRFTVQAGSPVAFLGTAYVLEALSARRAGDTVVNLLAQGAIPRIQEAVTFLRGHADADVDHVEQLAAMLADVDDPADREAIALSARVTRIVYPGVFSSGGDHLASREMSTFLFGTPSRS